MNNGRQFGIILMTSVYPMPIHTNLIIDVAIVRHRDGLDGFKTKPMRHLERSRNAIGRQHLQVGNDGFQWLMPIQLTTAGQVSPSRARTQG